jgi:hypothetical protein
VITKSGELKKELEEFFNVKETKGISSVKDFVFSAEDEYWGIPEPKFEVYRYKSQE